MIAPWASAHILLGERQGVQAQIAWLAEIGYRDADYIASLGDASPPRMQTPGAAKRTEKTPETR